MPYTPPAQQQSSDAFNSSYASSPPLSRSHSYLSSQVLAPQSPPATGRPSYLPRSISSSAYLSKHRRSPSASKLPDLRMVNPPAVKDRDSAYFASPQPSGLSSRGRIRSPPPVNTSLVHTGSIISPPESLHNSSDEEDNARGRGRELENLAELQAAIRTIEQRKDGSPTATDEISDRTRSNPDLPQPNGDGSLRQHETSADPPRPPLSKEARRISHSRSSTDSSLVFDVVPHDQTSVAAQSNRPEPDEDEDDFEDTVIRAKPPMLRKKSGELVRPALRPASANRRPSSMPGTPTYSKAVHFDSHLEHVKHFLQVDKPLAVSAGSSPVEAYENEIEFPFGLDDPGRSRAQPFRWDIQLSNFPDETEERKRLPVRVERVFLSADGKNLIGVVAVQNLAFQKQVITRFTLDYWKTTSEVNADFNNDVRRKHANDGCDRFNFTIKLTDQANLENKTMFFCIRYDVNGQQFWDNNGSTNYQVDFAKKPKAAGKNGMSGLGARPLNALPRTRPSPPHTAGMIRPRSMPHSFDDFSSGFDPHAPFSQSPTTVIGETPLKLKGPRPRAEIVPDAPTRRQKAGGQAFGNRYDFGASLSAAIQNASAILGDQSGLTRRPDPEEPSDRVSPSKAEPVCAPAQISPNNVMQELAGAKASTASKDSSTPVKPSALVSEKPPLQSQSYQELVDKYCFFGSAKTSPQLTQSTLGRVDGTKDCDSASISDVSVGSASTSSPIQVTNLPGGAQEAHPQAASPRLSRCSSPSPKSGSGLGSRTASPVSFGFPYHQPMNSGLFDTHTPTAIPG